MVDLFPCALFEHDGIYVLRLQGDVRVTLCATIDDYTNAMFTDARFASVLVDVSEAEGIDSTTLGLLAKLALRTRDEFGFTPVIYSTDHSITRLLNSMGFNRIFDIRDEICADNIQTSELPARNDGEEEVKGRVIEAHRVLMDLSEENRLRFQNLMQALEHP